MSVLDDVKDSLFTAGKEVSQKAKEASEIAKLKLDIKAKEDFVNKHYQELGRIFYETYQEEENSEHAEEFTVIREALEEMNRMQSEILRIQGAKECPACGTKMPENTAFCSKCGAKLDDMFED